MKQNHASQTYKDYFWSSFSRLTYLKVKGYFFPLPSKIRFSLTLHPGNTKKKS